jgi:hypothetical protein
MTQEPDEKTPPWKIHKDTPKPVMVIDPQCAKPYYITKTELKLYRAEYLSIPGVRIFVDGEEET